MSYLQITQNNILSKKSESEPNTDGTELVILSAVKSNYFVAVLSASRTAYSFKWTENTLHSLISYKSFDVTLAKSDSKSKKKKKKTLWSISVSQILGESIRNPDKTSDRQV